MDFVKIVLKLVLTAITLVLFSSSPVLAGNEEFYWSGKNYGRGVGTPGKIGGCDKGQVEDAGLCYKPCRQYYKGVGPVCWLEADVKSSYGRGAGYVPKLDKHLKQDCKGDDVIQDGLCYDKCRSGYHGRGPVCYNDDVKELSYGRGVGEALNLSCPGNKALDAGLCYDRCRAGFQGVGPMCWGEPPRGYVYCGLGFARSNSICSQIITAQVIGGAFLALDGFAAISAAGKAAQEVKRQEERAAMARNMSPRDKQLPFGEAATLEFSRIVSPLGDAIGAALKGTGGKMKSAYSFWKSAEVQHFYGLYKTYAAGMGIKNLAERGNRTDEEFALAEIRATAQGISTIMLVAEVRQMLAGNMALRNSAWWQSSADLFSAISVFAYPISE